MYKHSTIHRMKYQHDGGAIAYPPYELFSHAPLGTCGGAPAPRVDS
ncbi:hypothetical protein QUF61_00185 [Candidatus Venteria ishoeyi]|nr:hypothetical protein [Candidatus Venteria ishoeyi]MDM8544887.1 hypothetical protein [Candidatus Venteria ishoeyi]